MRSDPDAPGGSTAAPLSSPPSRDDGPRRRKQRPPARAPGEPSRSELRNQEVREGLAPLAPGERPAALLVAVAVAVMLGGANAIAFAAGARIDGRHPGAGVLTISAVMAALAAGMWARRYLAVLAFEALVAIAVAFFTLFLVEASNVEGLLLAVGVIVGGGWLFWKLVRVMSRLATPPRQSSS
jgi:hypothetical protein